MSPARRRRCGGRGGPVCLGEDFLFVDFLFARPICIYVCAHVVYSYLVASYSALPPCRQNISCHFLFTGGRGRPPVISSCSKDRAALPRNCLISDGYLFRCTSFAAPSRGRTAGANVALTASEHKGDCCPPPRASPSPSHSPLTMATATLGGNDQKVHVSFCCAFSCRIVVLVLIE